MIQPNEPNPQTPVPARTVVGNDGGFDGRTGRPLGAAPHCLCGATVPYCEHMFYQATLLGGVSPRFDDRFADLQRTWLDDTSWVDWVPHWLSGADTMFDLVHDIVAWHQRRNIKMYDTLVDEPRLVAQWHLDDQQPEPLAVLRDIRHVLIDRYREPFNSIGFNLYRDHCDSVAWHRDRIGHRRANPTVCLVSLGQDRPFRVRPRGGGASRSWSLGHGDLLVMGGACQHDFEHCVPKLSGPTGPRISIGFRWLDHRESRGRLPVSRSPHVT